MPSSSALVFVKDGAGLRAFAFKSGIRLNGVSFEALQSHECTNNTGKLEELLKTMTVDALMETLGELGLHIRQQKPNKTVLIRSILHQWERVKCMAHQNHVVATLTDAMATSSIAPAPTASHAPSSSTAVVPFQGEGYTLDDKEKVDDKGVSSAMKLLMDCSDTVEFNRFGKLTHVGGNAVEKCFETDKWTEHDQKVLLVLLGLPKEGVRLNADELNKLKEKKERALAMDDTSSSEAEEDRESISNYVDYLRDASDFEDIQQKEVSIKVIEGARGRVLFIFRHVDATSSVGNLKTMIEVEAKRRADAVVDDTASRKKPLVADGFYLLDEDGVKMPTDAILEDYIVESGKSYNILTLSLVLSLKGGVKGVKQTVMNKEKLDALKLRVGKVKGITVYDELLFFKNMIETFLTHAEQDGATTLHRLLSDLSVGRLDELSKMLDTTKGANMEAKMSDIAIKMFGESGDKIEALYHQCETLASFTSTSVCFAMTNSHWNISHLKKGIEALKNQKIGEQDGS